MGAWGNIYKVGLSAPVDSALGYGIVAIKNELIYNGFGKGIDPEYKDKNGNYFFGSGVTEQAKAFQQHVGVTADGEVGPITARALFRKRAHAVESQGGIPQDLLNRLKTLESNNDPAAIGTVDPNDWGLMQIHMPFHPDVTRAQAFDPAFSIVWGGGYLKGGYNSLHDWDGAVAAYNVGTVYAAQWVAAGKPKDGGPLLSDGTDIFTRASTYVSLVKKMPV
jgi:soluble lytic murein transglycosylase-like protein